MMNPSIDNIISQTSIATCIFSKLGSRDLMRAACVNKTWWRATQDVRSHSKLVITVELFNDIKNKDLKQYIKDKHKYVSDITIIGWSRGTSLPNNTYDSLFDSTLRLTARSLTLKGRGTWDTCHCPKAGSTCGEQFDTIKNCDITNLEYIHVSTTFKISSCALLDLISRSPKLKILRFYGLICNENHIEIFKSKRFLSNLEQVFWPFPKKNELPSLTILIKRNENISTLYANSATTCDLLAAEALGNLRNLSINLNENWFTKTGTLKRARKHLERIQYLSLAKNVEALEVRTYMDHDFFSESSEVNLKIEHLYENYKIKFWDQITKWPNLKYLAVYGAWELEETCREMVKHGLQVEYLKINLSPSSIIAAIEAGDDNPILTMPEGARGLRKLSCLRSIHFVCFEKLASIDSKTTVALKELMDLFWVVDIKTGFTDEVEDLLNSIMRRGNQLGKVFRVHLHIQPKDQKYANILVSSMLRFPPGTQLRSKLLSIADEELAKRNIKGPCENLFVWGLEQVDNIWDKAMYSRLKTNWRAYEERFLLNSSLKY